MEALVLFIALIMLVSRSIASGGRSPIRERPQGAFWEEQLAHIRGRKRLGQFLGPFAVGWRVSGGAAGVHDLGQSVGCAKAVMWCVEVMTGCVGGAFLNPHET
jgi:hypothetical protein